MSNVGEISEGMRRLGLSESKLVVKKYRKVMCEVSVIKKIGFGVEGDVMLVQYKGQKACMKRGGDMDMLMEQAEVMAKLDGAGGAPRVLVACSDMPMILMEYCEGATLAKVYATASPADRNRIESGVRSKVEELHRTGYCHCDIHNENVMVCGQPGEYEVRLIDFGCAEELSAESQEQHWKDVEEMLWNDEVECVD